MSEIQGVKFFSGRRVSCRLFVDTIAFMKGKISGITFYQQGSMEFLSESQKQPSGAFSLTILTGKNCVILNSVQEFIETEAWRF